MSDVLNGLMVEQNVFMGDHGETITKAVEIDPNETVQALVERTLYKNGKYVSVGESTRIPDADRYLVIRIAQRSFE